MPLSGISVRNAKPQQKPAKLFDGGGLFLFIAPTGGKMWRLKYRFQGKEKLLALGVYPDVGLKEAAKGVMKPENSLPWAMTPAK
ncbi:Arm DNA-binding domain-containing protein [uncultured Desulfovibrio sp.]|uniref:Arm DNA-binding domain-containing protein n=1 Tax=uncultured Desulfovibrio sp. TaxID=167968 RepID=UPI002629D25C|nr:Arm DNA-binding domain-containing protein [uncultured Desulfovibrio sp.]